MKLLLTTLFASALTAAFALASDCSKDGCDKEKKKEGTVLASDCKCTHKECGNAKCKECDSCSKAGDHSLAGCGDCDKKEGGCDKEKKDGTLLAEGCKKKKCGDSCDDEKKADGTLLAEGCKKKKCGDSCDDEKKAEGTLA